MKIRMIADLHFGHKNIAKYTGQYRGGATTMEEAHEWLIKQWNSEVGKHDLIWVLGDVTFSKKYLYLMSRLNGTKHLILGNHDKLPLNCYQKYFNKIHGFLKYKGFWLSHAPILGTRGLVNIHGHTHSPHTMMDEDHYCVCVEALNGKPRDLEDIKKNIEINNNLNKVMR